MDQSNCTGKKDGSKCSCKAKIDTCTPEGGATCKKGHCEQGSRPGDLKDCKGKKDGSKCSCRLKVIGCSPQGGARCKDGECLRGDIGKRKYGKYGK